MGDLLGETSPNIAHTHTHTSLPFKNTSACWLSLSMLIRVKGRVAVTLIELVCRIIILLGQTSVTWHTSTHTHNSMPLRLCVQAERLCVQAERGEVDQDAGESGCD